MRIYDIILKKRSGGHHTYEEIREIVHGYADKRVPDYQVSAWLMACFLNGLDDEETFYLTKAMLNSGKRIDLGFLHGRKVDKHSTGGVGDKISLILAPAAAACGLYVPMMSGRGLGFTGGTLDKLESIPGFDVNLTDERFFEVLKEAGYAMIGQSDDIAPADKMLYALRDVTATVESIPLITSSILSKKLAEGADAVVMDVKFGTGAFMKSKKNARELASSLVRVSKRMDHRVVCVLTSMDQPLGSAVGNALEVEESVAALQGRGEPDIVELTAVLGGHMLHAAEKTRSAEEGKERILETLADGTAYERFLKSVALQGGDVGCVTDPEKLPHASFEKKVLSDTGGVVCGIQTEEIGTASVLIGAGRFQKEDRIDPAAGIMVRKKIGDRVEKGETLAVIHYNDTKWLSQAQERVRTAYTIGAEKRGEFRLVHETIQ
jgi:pyrimidine-nucleoside phosphorylase